MISLLMLSLLSASDPEVIVREPRPASPWANVLRANCGRTGLVLSGYGAGRPIGATAELRVSGRPVTGSAMPRLLGDLSHKRAVYRFQILCARSGGVELRIGIGERQADGAVRYRSGGAFIEKGRLERYTGLEEADSDTFWFE